MYTATKGSPFGEGAPQREKQSGNRNMAQYFSLSSVGPKYLWGPIKGVHSYNVAYRQKHEGSQETFFY